MRQLLYLAWRYLVFHRLKTAILVGSLTLIIYLPIGLRVLVDQSSRQLTARAQATPLIIGAKGSPLELTLNTLYFRAEYPDPMRHDAAIRVDSLGLALSIPMYVRFHSQNHPIVGTTFEYFEYRGLRIESGRQLAVLGECVLGARAAAELGVRPGDHVISSPQPQRQHENERRRGECGNPHDYRPCRYEALNCKDSVEQLVHHQRRPYDLSVFFARLIVSLQKRRGLLIRRDGNHSRDRIIGDTTVKVKALDVALGDFVVLND